MPQHAPRDDKMQALIDDRLNYTPPPEVQNLPDDDNLAVYFRQPDGLLRLIVKLRLVDLGKSRLCAVDYSASFGFTLPGKARLVDLTQAASGLDGSFATSLLADAETFLSALEGPNFGTPNLRAMACLIPHLALKRAVEAGTLARYTASPFMPRLQDFAAHMQRHQQMYRHIGPQESATWVYPLGCTFLHTVATGAPALQPAEDDSPALRLLKERALAIDPARARLTLAHLRRVLNDDAQWAYYMGEN